MALELPKSIAVDVVDQHGTPVSDVLVALDLRHAGQYYYGTLLGLSDATGHVRVDRAALEQRFAEEQRLFLMDYRVPLDECDVEADIRADGGAAFRAQRAAAVDSPLVLPAAAEAWRQARNGDIRSAAVVVRLDEPDEDGVARARVIVRPQAI